MKFQINVYISLARNKGVKVYLHAFQVASRLNLEKNT